MLPTPAKKRRMQVVDSPPGDSPELPPPVPNYHELALRMEDNLAKVPLLDACTRLRADALGDLPPLARLCCRALRYAAGCGAPVAIVYVLCAHPLRPQARAVCTIFC